MPEPVQSDLASAASASRENPAASASPASPAEPVITPDQAVERCMTAYKRAYDAALAKGKSDYVCEEAGEYAFRVNMPSTASTAEIQAFIACVTRGIHLKFWRRNEPNQLFYAAQIALSTLKHQSGKR